MKIKDIEALTKSQQKTIYRWMQRHPKLEVADPKSLLGHPFPRPARKEGREVIWDQSEVEAWWEANASTVGRHPEESAIIRMSWDRYRRAMQIPPKVFEADGNKIVKDHMEMIERVERHGSEVRLWFRDVNDAVLFKLTY